MGIVVTLKRVAAFFLYWQVSIAPAIVLYI